jgi:hypothetical protein
MSDTADTLVYSVAFYDSYIPQISRPNLFVLDSERVAFHLLLPFLRLLNIRYTHHHRQLRGIGDNESNITSGHRIIQTCYPQ